MRRACVSLVLPPLALTIVAGCRDRAPRGPAPEPSPIATVGWDGTASVYDILGRDPRLIQLIQVPTRHLPADRLTVHPGPDAAPVRVVTACGDGYCVDGLVAADRIGADGAARPCAPAGWCGVLQAAALTADDREILTGDGSWLERGIAVAGYDAGLVSFEVADASFTAGAAHSNAGFRCRTQALGGDHAPASLGVLDPADLAVILPALDAFLAEAREAGDDRVRGGDRIDRDYPDFLLAGPRAVVICLPDDEGMAARLRVELPPRTATR